jgi:PAS domain S-box-containing protein
LERAEELPDEAFRIVLPLLVKKLVKEDKGLVLAPYLRFSCRTQLVPGTRRTSVLVIFLFTDILIGQPVANPQTPKTLPVREATAYQGDQPMPGRLGQTVTVQGIIIAGPTPLSSSAMLADLQDSTGGISLYSANSALLKGFHRGDDLRVTGIIQLNKGQTQILIRHIDRLGPGKLPVPRDVLVTNLLAARYLGQLVRAEGIVHSRKGSGGHTEITLTDRSGEIPIYVGSLLLHDPQLSRQLVEGRFASMIGVLNYAQPGSGPSQSGYRLIPRDSADFDFRPLPPYKLIATTLALVLLILMGIYLAFRRRSAERQACEMAALVANLKQSEKALRQSEQRYRLLFDRNLAGLFHSTLDGRILDCNESFARMFGYASRDEVLALPGGAQEFFSGSSERESFTSELQKKKVLTNLEMRFRRKDGSPVWVLENASLLDGDGNAPPLIEGTVVDITERKHLEEQSRQAQKMEAIGRLAGGVAHDFNNLLTIISGNSELLLDRIDPAKPPHKNVSQIKKAADQASDLVRQLLAFSRMQVLQPSVLDLNRILSDTVKMLPRLLCEDIEVVLVPGASLGLVKADKNQIDQIILNLAVNARDAMPQGGKLTIQTADADLDESYARLHSPLKPGKYVTLAVTDTGMGMDSETQAHIFEPFFTTKGPGKGTGLGLATVYGIVKQSGGWIWVFSELGRGTTVKIYLPRIEQVVPGGTSSASRPSCPRGTETILFVEDQEGIRDLARPFLEDMGYKVLEAGDGEAALKIAKQYKGEIHLLLTDVVMPKMGGHAVAKRMVVLRPGVRVLYISGYAEYAAPDQDSYDGGFRLQKPFAMDTLARKVREALNAKQSAAVRSQ